MTEANFPYHFLHHTPWATQGSSLWPASTFTLRRNLARYPFPHKQTKAQALHIMECLKEAFFNTSLITDPIFLDFSQLAPTQKEFLFEHFFVPDAIFEDRPHQGLITDASGTFLAGINLYDHLILQLVDCTSSWHKTWNTLRDIETNLGQRVDYAFSTQFGYLTTNIHHCGTGLHIRAYLHLPAILYTNNSDTTFSSEEDFVISHIGADDQQDSFQGDVVVLQNKYSLGTSEDHVLRNLYSAANRLVNSEREVRLTIKTGSFPDIKDMISRSFGVLLHSYQIPTQEALAALSLLKLGVDLGWVQGLSDTEINNLFFKCRQGHLVTHHSQELSTEELLHKRAEFIHSALKEAKLVI
jgi:protein arginine kinase